MEIRLKERLRALRQKKGATQEQLAAHLGITQQSVGKWERGEGFPDITLLPAIALYFGTTVDDLLGVERARIESEIEACAQESLRLRNAGKIKEDLALWEEAYADFPEEERVRFEYMNALYSVYAEDIAANAEKGKRILALGDSLLETEWREAVLQILCYTCHYQGDTARAKQYAEMMGGFYWSARSELLKIILKGEEAVKVCQQNMQSLVDMAAENAFVMSWQGEYGDDDKIRIFTFAAGLYQLLYTDGDYGFYACRLAQYYGEIALCHTRMGRAEECLAALEEMVRYAVLADTQPNGAHTSLLVDRLFYRREETTKNYTENTSGLRLKTLQQPTFDFLRGDMRFGAVLQKLERTAKQ